MNPIIWDLNECLGGFEMINNGGGPPRYKFNPT